MQEFMPSSLHNIDVFFDRMREDAAVLGRVKGNTENTEIMVTGGAWPPRSLSTPQGKYRRDKFANLGVKSNGTQESA
eukprot:6481020-Amphidinium_carterae.1